MSPLLLSTLGLIVCFLILTFCGKYLVNISIKLARNIGVSDVLIGTTLVALMTGAPTLLVSIMAFVGNQHDIALGNLIGTNYVNLGLALGIPAFMTTIMVKQEVFEKEIPLYFAITALFTALIIDKQVSRMDGIILALFLIAAWVVVIQYGYFHKNKEVEEDFKKVVGLRNQKINAQDVGKQLISIALLVLVILIASFGITLLTPIFSQATGISNYILGLTLVGIGTSIPTIVASIVAAKKGNNDLIVGNVFGGNILNLGLGIGLLAIINPINVPQGVINDTVFVNIYGAVIVILVLAEMRLFGKMKTLSRLSGIIIVVTYLAYTVYTIVTATQ
jgi:cation:H+ antiporter